MRMYLPTKILDWYLPCLHVTDQGLDIMHAFMEPSNPATTALKTKQLVSVPIPPKMSDSYCGHTEKISEPGKAVNSARDEEEEPGTRSASILPTQAANTDAFNSSEGSTSTSTSSSENGDDVPDTPATVIHSRKISIEDLINHTKDQDEDAQPVADTPIRANKPPVNKPLKLSSLKAQPISCCFDDNEPCTTGQRTIGECRKAVSDHFGRNKAETQAIQNWKWICRKHYQRGAYQVEQWQERKLHMIMDQLELIEAQKPGVTYTVGFASGEKERLSDYYTISAQNPDKAKSLLTVRPKDSKQAPIWVLKELDNAIRSKGNSGNQQKTMEDCIGYLMMIGQWREEGKIIRIPQIEFVPEGLIPATQSASIKRKRSSSATSNPCKRRDTGSGAAAYAPEQISSTPTLKKENDNQLPPHGVHTVAPCSKAFVSKMCCHQKPGKLDPETISIDE
jgi:hypothetical protein